MKIRTVVFLFVLTLTLAESQFIRNNVVFKKINEIRISESSWTVTMVLDLNPYKNLLDDSLKDITKVTKLIWETIRHQSKFLGSQFTNHFEALEEKLRHLNNTRLRIEESFNNYRSLSRRSKRAVIPFIGFQYFSYKRCHFC